MMDHFMYSLEDDIFDIDYYDSPIDYSDDISSTGSNESDAENNPFTPCSYMSGKIRHGGKKVLQRKAANLRERRRMKSINEAFDTLRTCIPTKDSMDRKLSKVDTLKLAMNYIQYLSELIKSTDDFSQATKKSDADKRPEKFILRCQHIDNDPSLEDYDPLFGHSLTWSSDKDTIPQKVGDHRLCAKIWYPSLASERDMENLASYSNDFGNVS